MGPYPKTGSWDKSSAGSNMPIRYREDILVPRRLENLIHINLLNVRSLRSVGRVYIYITHVINQYQTI